MDVVVVYLCRTDFLIVSVRNDTGEEVDRVVKEVEAVVQGGDEVGLGPFRGGSDGEVVGEGSSQVGFRHRELDRAVEQGLFGSRESGRFKEGLAG